MQTNNQKNMLWSLKKTYSTTKQGKIEKKKKNKKKEASKMRRNVSDMTGSTNTSFFVITENSKK